MKIIVYVIGGLFAMALLAVLWALRIAAWLAAFGCAACLLLALFSVGHPVAMWAALSNAGLLLGFAMLVYALPMFWINHQDHRVT